MTVDDLPYWLVNVPREQWPRECPDFLVHANAKDRGILSTRDERYRSQTWEEVKEIIGTARFRQFSDDAHSNRDKSARSLSARSFGSSQVPGLQLEAQKRIWFRYGFCAPRTITMDKFDSKQFHTVQRSRLDCLWHLSTISRLIKMGLLSY